MPRDTTVDDRITDIHATAASRRDDAAGRHQQGAFRVAWLKNDGSGHGN
jgi:hypothetical protein